MMLQMPMAGVVSGHPDRPIPTLHVSGGRLRDDPALLAVLEGSGSVLGKATVVQAFDEIEPGTIHAGDMRVLSSIVIVAGRSDVIIEQTDDGQVLTATRGSNNDCRLIFRHAYGRACCELRTTGSSADAHLGFLDHRRFEEVQTFSISRPRSMHGECRGSLWTTLEFRADPLCELQGIVWRGGLLQIAKLTLVP
jgi:hypothetical protein